jgi:hypothetical protein
MKMSAYFTSVLHALLLALGPMQAQLPMQWRSIPLSTLCVTEGTIQEDSQQGLLVDDTKMRAFVTTATSQDIQVAFTYFGPSKTETPLGSGIMRRQFGLKLQAPDPCNLVYAMWRFAPKSEIVVSVKSNPGQRTSAECGNRGYTNLKAAHASPVAAPTPGSNHSLRAEMTGQELRVYADDRLVWQGTLDSSATGLRGPVGIRSDNVKLAFTLRAGEMGGAHPQYRLACKPGSGENE